MFSCRQQLYFSRHQQHAAAQRLPCRRCGSAHRRVRCWGRPTQRWPFLDVATPTTAADGALFGLHATRFDIRPWTALWAHARTWSAEVLWSSHADAVSLLARLTLHWAAQHSTDCLQVMCLLPTTRRRPPSTACCRDEQSVDVFLLAATPAWYGRASMDAIPQSHFAWW